jgi:hypothetical protein
MQKVLNEDGKNKRTRLIDQGTGSLQARCILNECRRFPKEDRQCGINVQKDNELETLNGSISSSCNGRVKLSISELCSVGLHTILGLLFLKRVEDGLRV